MLKGRTFQGKNCDCKNFLIAHVFLFVDVRKTYFSRETIFVGISLQTKLGANLFSGEVRIFFCGINLHFASYLQICKLLICKFFQQQVFPLKIEEIPYLQPNTLIYILSN